MDVPALAQSPHCPRIAPGNFAMLLGISSGTAVTATLISQTHGDKSSGPVQPSVGDLISDGGVVVPDRFQLLLWTGLVCIGYLVVLAVQNPGSAQFPDIPQGVLYLAGISAATYAGAKLTRDPGPILKTVESKKTTGSTDIQFDIAGSNLSNKATFAIDGTQVQVDPSKITGVVQDGSSELYSSLSVTATSVTAYQSGDHTLRIINPDGRSADVAFTCQPPAISKLTPNPPGIKPDSIKTGTQPTVDIGGTDFRDKSTVKWLAPLSDKAADAKIAKITQTNVSVSLEAGDRPGTGTLTVVSPNGIAVATAVDVTS